MQQDIIKIIKNSPDVVSFNNRATTIYSKIGNNSQQRKYAADKLFRKFKTKNSL